MAPPSKSSAHGGKGSDNHGTPSNNLWVGNVTGDVSDTDLMKLFSKYGAVDSVTSYPSRCYAFVYFKHVDDAKAALEALQGTLLSGSPLKIEFAKPAKPCKSLWVSGISTSTTKEAVEEEFLKFGEIEEFKFLRDRNTAYVDYFRIEDASQALKSMNGKRIGGDPIRVDFLRSHTTKREQRPLLPEATRNYSEPTHSGSKREQYSQSSGGRKGDGQPSNILWIGYPPSVHVDDQMLHNAMILFGEIEKVTCIPSRHYSFVEFRSVDEARRAKEGLQGRLFNDPRISILYSNSGLAPNKDYPGCYPGVKGPRADVLLNDPQFPAARIDMFNHNRPMVPNTLSGPGPSSGILGPHMPIRPFGPQGSFEPLLSGPDLNDLTVLHKLSNANPNSLGGPNWRRSSPAPEMRLSPPQGAKRQMRPLSGAWDVFDANQLPRESKRSRIDTVYDYPFPTKEMDDRTLGLEQLYGLGPQVDGGGSGPVANIQEKNRFNPAEGRITTGGTGYGHQEHDCIWRGVIAKGGTPVCHARCVPLGEIIESKIPEVVNCSARTGLDMLTKHYADAIGFDIVFFLPDSEDDFASYTEFLHYLGAKNRAGVAKFEDGTTLFLVPPSDFLSKVLNVAGPERLYGVVLKFPNVPSSSVQPQSFQSHFIDGQPMRSQNQYSGMPQKEEQVLQMDYNRFLREDSMQLAPSTTDFNPIQPAPSVSTAGVPQPGATLTPELIASLALLLPASAKPFSSETSQPTLGSSSMMPSLPSSTELDRGFQPHGWMHERQDPEQTGHPLLRVENQYNLQSQQLAQLQNYQTASNTSSNLALEITDYSQSQDPVFNRQHQHDGPQNTQKGFGMAHGTDTLGSYGSSLCQQSPPSVAFSNQVYGSGVTAPNAAMALGADKGNNELPNQVQQLQSSIYGAGQGTSAVEVDKNQRYQSTLQFAANLLLQIQQQQQQQQQTTTQAGQGSANH